MTVRRERVILDLEDNFTTGMLRAAGATQVLDSALNDLNRSTVVTRQSVHTFVDDDSGGLRRLVKDAGIADTEFRDLSARTLMFADALAILTPAMLPIAAVAIPALTGLASAFGFVTLATGTAILAFQGVGDALDAVNKAQLDPTEANLEAARLQMEQLSVAGQKLVTHLQELRPALTDLRDTGAAAMFPGIERGLENLMQIMPQFLTLAHEFGKATGDIFASGTKSLGTARWTEFFDFLAENARPTLKMVAATVGDLAHGLAELWMAFQPLNEDFGRVFADAADSFDKWAAGLAETQGFKDFASYIRETGPQVAATLGAIASAMVQIIEAMAPLGGPALKALEQLADVLSIIANSPLGPAILATVAAMAALRMSARVVDGALRSGPVTAFKQLTAAMYQMRAASGAVMAGSTKNIEAYATAAKSARGALMQLAKPTALVAGLALASSGMADSMGMANTASMALMGGLVTGSPWGAALGGAIGIMLDFKAANEATAQAAQELTDSLNQQTGAVTGKTIDMLIDNMEEYADATKDAGYNTGQAVAAIVAGGPELAAFSDAIAAAREKALEPGNTGVIADAMAFDAVNEAANGYNKTLDEGKSKILANVAAVAAAAGAHYDEAAAIRESTQAMREQRAERLRAVNAEINFQSALLDAKDALKENGKAFDQTTRAGQANKTALVGILAAWNGLSTHSKNIPGRFESVKAAFIKTAVAMGMGKVAAEALATAILEIPTSRKFQMKMETEAARAELESFKRYLAGLNFDKVGHVRMIGTGLGPVTGPVWTGGYTGPGGVMDPAGEVHKGELVIPKWLEEQDRSFLKGRYGGRLPGYAGGGLVGSAMSTSSGSDTTSAAVRDLGREAKESARTIAAERKQRAAAIKEKKSSLASTVSGSFLSDLFGEESPWAAGSDFMSTLQGDTRSARQFARLLRQLAKKGLSGDALAALAESGNMAAASQMAHMSRRDIRMYELAFNRRARAARDVGRYAGRAAYGGGGGGGGDVKTHHALAEAVGALHHIRRQLHTLPEDTGDAVGDSIKSSARKGARRQARGGPRIP